MTQRLVMLDANLIIRAFDKGALVDEQLRDQAKEKVNSLASDPEVKFVTTPMIRYEVLCKPSSLEAAAKLKQILSGYKTYEISESIANCAVEIYQAKSDAVKPNDMKKHKFDIFHVATAWVNKVDLKSVDDGVNGILDLFMRHKEGRKSE